MSYQVLARKYRPKSFDILVGQEHVVRALTHALEQQRLHHAYLFTGTRGVGKTTLSRILAKSFNCEKGVTAQACGECEACVAIDAGRYVDYIEMDAASNRGVEEMASLLEQAIYAPSNARFKVYMIDEVHMLTNHAFNAMLKTLEEPPAHIKFILATTDPQKIPVTVLSRCLQFNLKQMPPGHIVGHLENILGQEGIAFETPALRLLAQGAHGSMRDALSLTDQAIAYAAGQVSLDAVQNMLGALDQSYLIRILDALAREDGVVLMSVADEMAARSLSYKAALQDLGSLLHQIAIAQMVPAALPEELPERAELLRLSQVLGKEEVQLFYQIVVHGRNEIGLAPDEYAGFSMTLLRMLAFRPGSLGKHSSSTLNQGGAGGAQARSLPSASSPSSSNPSAPNKIAGTSQGVPNGAATMPNVTRADAASPQVSPQVSHHGSPQAAMSPTTITAAPIKQNDTAPANSAATKPMSPAMAALAAARAASASKSGARPGAGKPVTSAFESSAVAIASAPPQQALPATPVLDRPPILPAAKMEPVTSEVKHEVKAASTPPWDDVDLALAEACEHAKDYSGASDWDFAAAPVVNTPAVAVPTSRDLESTPLLAETLNPSPANENSASSVGGASSSNSQAKSELKLMPMAQIAWDGHWPNLAASLQVRGVAQQLAQQSELRACTCVGNAIVFKLCVPLQTLLSAGSVEKLSAALSERFSEFDVDIRVETEIGAVEQTANAQAMAERTERLNLAEQAIYADQFVQTLMRDFGATIVTGSIVPLAVSG